MTLRTLSVVISTSATFCADNDARLDRNLSVGMADAVREKGRTGKGRYKHAGADGRRRARFFTPSATIVRILIGAAWRRRRKIAGTAPKTAELSAFHE